MGHNTRGQMAFYDRLTSPKEFPIEAPMKWQQAAYHTKVTDRVRYVDPGHLPSRVYEKFHAQKNWEYFMLTEFRGRCIQLGSQWTSSSITGTPVGKVCSLRMEIDWVWIEEFDFGDSRNIKIRTNITGHCFGILISSKLLHFRQNRQILTVQ